VQPLVSLALAHVAHATIRNRGTTVGSIVHADAAAEMPMVLVLLGGSVTVTSSSDGDRTIAAEDLFAGPMESTLRHDEIALHAFFPALRPGEGVAFEELARRHGDYALCGVGAVVRLEGDRVVEARTGYLSVSDVPTVVDVTAALAEEGALRDQALDQASDLALAELDPADDIHATAAYRAHLVRVLTRRVLGAAYDDALGRRSVGATP
jgi:carbon-monoxide dehydrogenase medium subunit